MAPPSQLVQGRSSEILSPEEGHALSGGSVKEDIARLVGLPVGLTVGLPVGQLLWHGLALGLLSLFLFSPMPMPLPMGAGAMLHARLTYAYAYGSGVLIFLDFVLLLQAALLVSYSSFVV